MITTILKVWHVVTHPCQIFNNSSAKPLLIGHGWVIIPHKKPRTYLQQNICQSVLTKEVPISSTNNDICCRLAAQTMTCYQHKFCIVDICCWRVCHYWCKITLLYIICVRCDCVNPPHPLLLSIVFSKNSINNVGPQCLHPAGQVQWVS